MNEVELGRGGAIDDLFNKRVGDRPTHLVAVVLANVVEDTLVDRVEHIDTSDDSGWNRLASIPIIKRQTIIGAEVDEVENVRLD